MRCWFHEIWKLSFLELSFWYAIGLWIWFFFVSERKGTKSPQRKLIWRLDRIWVHHLIHGAHCPGMSCVFKTVLNCPRFLQKYFNLSLSVLNFFHLLSVSIFQCTVLIWYVLMMMIIIVMVNDSNYNRNYYWLNNLETILYIEYSLSMLEILQKVVAVSFVDDWYPCTIF